MKSVEEMLSDQRIEPSAELRTHVRSIARPMLPGRALVRVAAAAVLIALLALSDPGVRAFVASILDAPNTVSLQTDEGRSGSGSIADAGAQLSLPVPAFVPEGYEVLSREGESQDPIGEWEPEQRAAADASITFRRPADSARIIVMSRVNGAEVIFHRYRIQEEESRANPSDLIYSDRGTPAVTSTIAVTGLDRPVRLVEWEIDRYTLAAIAATHLSFEEIRRVAQSMGW